MLDSLKKSCEASKCRIIKSPLLPRVSTNFLTNTLKISLYHNTKSGQDSLHLLSKEISLAMQWFCMMTTKLEVLK